VESIYPDAGVAQQRIRSDHPNLAALNDQIFSGRSLTEQLAIQAAGERLGAGTWRAFAAAHPDGTARTVFLACAPLEEASALFLEGLRGA
jgi:hypothetical protein